MEFIKSSIDVSINHLFMAVYIVCMCEHVRYSVYSVLYSCGHLQSQHKQKSDFATPGWHCWTIDTSEGRNMEFVGLLTYQTTDHVRRLTCQTIATLDYWHTTSYNFCWTTDTSGYLCWTTDMSDYHVLHPFALYSMYQNTPSKAKTVEL